MYINHTSNTARQLAQITGYGGHNFQVIAAEKVNPSSYWDEGGRSLYYAVSLANGEAKKLDTEAHPMFNASRYNKVTNNGEGWAIPEGVGVVEHRQGPYPYVILFVRQDNMPLGIKENKPLSQEEKIVLFSTSFKSSYAGISNYRFVEAARCTRIKHSAYEAAKESLIAKGFLDKRGAITTDGRNAKSKLGHDWPRLGGD